MLYVIPYRTQNYKKNFITSFSLNRKSHLLKIRVAIIITLISNLTQLSEVGS